jgi:calcium-dependent protein kinase
MNPKVIAGCLSEEEIRGLKEMFKSMDADNSGTITVDELRRGLAKQGTKLSEAEVEQLMAAVSFVLVFFFTRARLGAEAPP